MLHAQRCGPQPASSPAARWSGLRPPLPERPEDLEAVRERRRPPQLRDRQVPVLVRVDEPATVGRQRRVDRLRHRPRGSIPGQELLVATMPRIHVLLVAHRRDHAVFRMGPAGSDPLPDHLHPTSSLLDWSNVADDLVENQRSITVPMILLSSAAGNDLRRIPSLRPGRRRGRGPS
jgi:hypothetical protein